VADSVRGNRQFVVGTGGSNHTSFTAIWPNSESRNATAFGVLKLTLRATSYDWQFVPEAGSAFTDSGTTQCHGTVADTTPPTAPGNLTASAVAPNQIDLSWSGSTDDFGVVGYRLSRDGAVLTTVTSTSYSDTGVQPNSTHVYTVVAIDEGGNSSPVSNPATASTPADTSPPSPPFNLIATAPNGFLVDLVWGASTDDVGVSEYEVFRDGLAVGTSSTTSFADTTVDATTTYSYTVVARDSSTNRSEPSNVATVTTPAPPTTLSFTPSDDAYVQSDQTASNFGLAGQLVADASPSRRILLKFAVTGVRGRQVVSAKLYLRCVDPSSNGGDFRRADSSWSESTVTWSNQPVADSVARSSLGSVAAGSTYEVDVTSLVTGDGVHTIRVDSTSSNGAYYSSKEGSVAPRLVLTTTSSSSDTMKPTAPTNLVATAPTTNAVELVWSESTDDVGVTAYDVFRADLPAKVGTTSTTSFSDTNVQPNSTYGYHVVARDAAGNASDPSATTFVTTPASSTLTFTPNDDAFIDSTRPTSSFGSTASLEVDNSPVKHVLLKFTVTGAQGRTVTGARLRLRCVDPATSGGSFHRVSNLSWSETTVTWNSAPAADSSAFGMLGAVSTGNWYEITVPFITGDGTYAIRITSQSSNGADYSAKEGSFAPQLVISLS
jgi:fibronectin type 3 domain-containing protein